VSDDPEFIRLQQEAEAAQARHVAEMEALIAAEIARVRREEQDFEQHIAEQQQRITEQVAAAQQAVAEATAASNTPSHLTSWQQEEVARQLQLARQAAEAARTESKREG
jgi:hypothetical protein